MSSKKYRGKPCVYCLSDQATTGDHVFARQFVPETKRGNMPQVPACARCNSDKSRLESYLTTLLPFGAYHADASAQLEHEVPRRLSRNAKLKRQLETGASTILVRNASGNLDPAMALPFDPEQLERWAEYVARGLLWHHWQYALPTGHSAVAACTDFRGEQWLDSFFRPRAVALVDGDIAEGMFVYRGIKTNLEGVTMTWWKISLFGGVQLAEDPKKSEVIARTVGAITGPRVLLDELMASDEPKHAES